MTCRCSQASLLCFSQIVVGKSTSYTHPAVRKHGGTADDSYVLFLIVPKRPLHRPHGGRCYCRALKDKKLISFQPSSNPPDADRTEWNDICFQETPVLSDRGGRWRETERPQYVKSRPCFANVEHLSCATALHHQHFICHSYQVV